MFERYGFEVIPEEQDNMKLTDRTWYDKYPYFTDDRLLVKFVEFSRYETRFVAVCYYQRNFAKDCAMKDEEILKAIFPKSFAHGNSGEIYNKVFKGG